MRRAGKQREPVGPHGSERVREAARERAGRGERDLLAEHRLRRDLERVDVPGDAQVRPGGDERPEHVVVPQVLDDRRQVVTEPEPLVEQLDDARARRRAGSRRARPDPRNGHETRADLVVREVHDETQEAAVVVGDEPLDRPARGRRARGRPGWRRGVRRQGLDAGHHMRGEVGERRPRVERDPHDDRPVVGRRRESGHSGGHSGGRIGGHIGGHGGHRSPP